MEEKFTYSVVDFLKDKLFGIPVWLEMILTLFISTSGLIPYCMVWVATYFVLMWKRHQFFNKKVQDWKTVRII
jgi:hypothetical protein